MKSAHLLKYFMFINVKCFWAWNSTKPVFRTMLDFYFYIKWSLMLHPICLSKSKAPAPCSSSASSYSSDSSKVRHSREPSTPLSLCINKHKLFQLLNDSSLFCCLAVHWKKTLFEKPKYFCAFIDIFWYLKCLPIHKQQQGNPVSIFVECVGHKT